MTKTTVADAVQMVLRMDVEGFAALPSRSLKGEALQEVKEQRHHLWKQFRNQLTRTNRSLRALCRAKNQSRSAVPHSHLAR